MGLIRGYRWQTADGRQQKRGASFVRQKFCCRLLFAVCRLLVLAVVISSPTAHVRAADFFLDCTFRGGEGIFAPQQSLILDVILRPTSPHNHASAPLTLNASLTNVSLPDRPVIAGFTTQITPNVPLPLSFVTPDRDGVYEIVFYIMQAGRASRPIEHLVPLTMTPERIETRRQFVVLGSQVPLRPAAVRPTGDWTLTDRRTLSLTSEYRLHDESSRRRLPNLSQLSNVPQLPPFPRVAELPRITDLPRPAALLGRIPRPFNRRGSQAFPLDLFAQAYLEYGMPLLHLPDSRHVSEQSEQNPDFSALSPAGISGSTWYSLTLDTEVGVPYLVEIDFPVNIPQTLGIAIVNDLSPWQDRGGWGGILNAATSIHIAEEIVQDTHTETVASHRLLFWATSEDHELVLLNRQPHREALFRNIRISRVTMPGMQEDQRMPRLFGGTAQRKRIGQILGASSFPPLLNENAVSMLPSTLPSTVTDWTRTPPPIITPIITNWQEVYEHCSRLIDTLHRGGYDGVTLTVISRQAAFYPQGTADGLEMIFRRFDNEGLTLIPAIEFDMPLASLELLLRQHPGITEEILIGNPGSADQQGRQYNVLHPAVQQAMAETVLGLVDRLGHHSSFGGVAIVLSPETYAGLPFGRFVPDDHTFMQFRQDTERELGIPFPDEQQLRQALPTHQFLVQKNAQRLQFLESDPVWATWVRWRAARISKFYAELAQQVATRARGASPPVNLYLLGGTMLDQPGIEQFCLPTLPRNFAPLQAIQLLGFDLPLISRTESLHFLKPVIISTERHHSYEGLDSADTAPLFSKLGAAHSGMLTGVQFVHTDTDYFVTTPAHVQSRRRFVRQLAQADVLMFMDAGVSLPFGQEHAKFDLLDTYRRLPPVPFRTFQTGGLPPPPARENSLQPLTVRYHNSPDGLMVYIVNDAPFAVEADFFFTADSRSSMSELTGHRMIRSFSAIRPPAGSGIPANESPQRAGSHTWRASLQPYDLLAIHISDTNARIESVLVHRPPSVEEALKQRVDKLVQRLHAARGGVLLDRLVNTDFESPLDATGGIPGWQSFGNSLTVLLDHTVSQNHTQDHTVAGTGQNNTRQNSVRLTNVSAEPGTFLSQPFNMPATGRLDVSMLVGIPADAGSLPMSIVLSAQHRGQSPLEQPIHRHAPVGETLMPLLAHVEPRNGVRWHRLVVPFRLPLEPLEEVRIGVQYSGIGTVWIDDITLQHVSFLPHEIVELQKKLVVADQRWSSGRFSELISLLESYWAQFLFEHVPAPTPQPVISAARSPIAAEAAPPPQQSRTLYQRVRGWFGVR